MKKRYFIIIITFIVVAMLLPFTPMISNKIAETGQPLDRVDVVGGFKTNLDSEVISFVRYVVDYKYYKEPLCYGGPSIFGGQECMRVEVKKFKTILYVYDIDSRSFILKKDISDSAISLGLYESKYVFPDYEYVCDYNFLADSIEIFSNRECLRSDVFSSNKISYLFKPGENNIVSKKDMSNLKKTNPFSGNLIGIGVKGSERFRFKESFYNSYRQLRVGTINQFSETDSVFADNDLDKYTNDDVRLGIKIFSFIGLITSISGPVR